MHLYGGLGRSLLEERILEIGERIQTVQTRELAKRAYPGLPEAEAIQRYQAVSSTATLTDEAWPILLAAAAGLAVFTVMKR